MSGYQVCNVQTYIVRDILWPGQKQKIQAERKTWYCDYITSAEDLLKQKSVLKLIVIFHKYT